MGLTKARLSSKFQRILPVLQIKPQTGPIQKKSWYHEISPRPGTPKGGILLSELASCKWVDDGSKCQSHTPICGCKVQFVTMRIRTSICDPRHEISLFACPIIKTRPCIEILCLHVQSIPLFTRDKHYDSAR
jgi:hypothetical protein